MNERGVAGGWQVKLKRRVKLIKFVGINFKKPIHLKWKDGGILEAA